MCTRHHFIPYPKHTAHPKIIHGPTFQLQPVSYKRYFRCNNGFLLLVYTIHLSLSTKVDPPPMPYHLFKTHVNICTWTYHSTTINTYNIYRLRWGSKKICGLPTKILLSFFSKHYTKILRYGELFPWLHPVSESSAGCTEQTSWRPEH